MSWKKELVKKFKLYAVTDVSSKDDSSRILSKIDAVCRGGADVLQLRAKSLSDSEFLRMGAKVRAITEKQRVLFFVNDRADVALYLHADGVHVGQEDMPVSWVRRLAASSHKKLLVGKSTHSKEQVRCALTVEQPDYFAVGPVFSTPTKPTYRAVSLDLVRWVAAQTPGIPWLCIGGINLNNINQVLKSGATRIAAVRALFGVNNCYVETKKFKKILSAQVCS